VEVAAEVVAEVFVAEVTAAVVTEVLVAVAGGLGYHS